MQRLWWSSCALPLSRLNYERNEQGVPLRLRLMATGVTGRKESAKEGTEILSTFLS
jgi:hypothetical protein